MRLKKKIGVLMDNYFLKNNRIRDIDYDQDLDLIIILTENVPAIVTIKKIV